MLKLLTLYTALKDLAAKFPQVEVDVKGLWSDIETAIANRSWSLSALRQVAGDAYALITDFAASWTGGAEAWESFRVALGALFTK
jgi:hypothetical protein